MDKGYYYKGIGPEAGTIVTAGEAFSYALERCLHGTLEEQREFTEMLEEWYYSNDRWIKEGIWNQ